MLDINCKHETNISFLLLSYHYFSRDILIGVMEM